MYTSMRSKQMRWFGSLSEKASFSIQIQNQSALFSQNRMEVLALGNRKVHIIITYHQKKTCHFHCGNKAHTQQTSPNSSRLDAMKPASHIRKVGQCDGNFLSVAKKFRPMQCLDRQVSLQNIIKFDFNYYYYEILEKINFTLLSSSLSHLMPGTELDYKILYLNFFL